MAAHQVRPRRNHDRFVGFAFSRSSTGIVVVSSPIALDGSLAAEAAAAAPWEGDATDCTVSIAWYLLSWRDDNSHVTLHLLGYYADPAAYTRYIA